MFARARLLLTALFVLATSGTALADDIAFRRHVINPDSEFMAAAVFDVNKDGKLDIVASSFEGNAVTLLLGR
jgi:hypothetical protein